MNVYLTEPEVIFLLKASQIVAEQREDREVAQISGNLERKIRTMLSERGSPLASL